VLSLYIFLKRLNLGMLFLCHPLQTPEHSKPICCDPKYRYIGTRADSRLDHYLQGTVAPVLIGAEDAADCIFFE
jgi:hypothetical protein